MSRRVLYIIGSGNIGGREKQLLRLATELASSGWQPGVAFLTGGGPITEALRAAGIPVWVPAAGRRERREQSAAAGPSVAPNRMVRTVRTIGALLTATRTLRRAAREHRPDVVHAMLPTSVWLGLPALAAVRPLRRPRPRRVAGIYGFTPRMYPMKRRIYRWQLRRSHAVVANAPHLLDDARHTHGVAPERAHLLANGVDLPATTADVRAEPPVAVVVANFHAYKGHADLLHALALLPPAAALTVRLCGTGAEREATRALAAELGVGGRVVFVDPPADVVAELAGAQFAIHPSHTEGLSNAILEQLAAGLPVLACRVGGNPVLVADGVNGSLVPVADPAALAAAILALATAPELRARMGAAARLTAERFSWPACTRAHAELYEQLLAGAPR